MGRLHSAYVNSRASILAARSSSIYAIAQGAPTIHDKGRTVPLQTHRRRAARRRRGPTGAAPTRYVPLQSKKPRNRTPTTNSFILAVPPCLKSLSSSLTFTLTFHNEKRAAGDRSQDGLPGKQRTPSLPNTKMLSKQAFEQCKAQSFAALHVSEVQSSTILEPCNSSI